MNAAQKAAAQAAVVFVAYQIGRRGHGIMDKSINDLLSEGRYTLRRKAGELVSRRSHRREIEALERSLGAGSGVHS